MDVCVSKITHVGGTRKKKLVNAKIITVVDLKEKGNKQLLTLATTVNSILHSKLVE